MEPFAGRLRVLELYSGIGGMHWALKESGVDFDVVQALDVNTTANKIYSHNFRNVTVSASSITKLTIDQLSKWAPNTVLMSPPCQPFTRVGKKQDCQDPRTESFLHILDLLRQLEHRPEYILVENVKGFEVSEARQLLLDTLKDCNYIYQEFLLTPLQFGIPNCRMRYYLIAKMKPLEFAFRTSDQIFEDVPAEAIPLLPYVIPLQSSGDQTVVSDLRHRCSALRRASRSSRSCSPSTSRTALRASSPAVRQGQGQTSSIVKSKSDDEQSNDGAGTSVSRNSQCSSHSEDSKDKSIISKQSEPAKSEVVAKVQISPEEISRCKGHGIQMSETRTAHGGGVSTDSGAGGDEEGCDLTIAEAGRNMRHCEEEDVLVCEDGSRLDEYLETGDQAYFRQFLLEDKELRMFVVMDVVHPSFRKSSCFTKRYGHYVEGAGSLLMMTDDVQIVKDASEFKSWAVEHKNRKLWGEAELSTLRRLKLRYFTPREVANLLCFPPQFEFPVDVNTIQCHRVLGNSLNVHVVSVLIQLMLMEPGVI